MDDRHISPELLTQLDAYRPGRLEPGSLDARASDAAASSNINPEQAFDEQSLVAQLEQNPSLRAAQRRIAAWDREIAAALDDVPVPVGLEQRLLAQLHIAARTAEGDSSTVDEPIMSPALESAAKANRRTEPSSLWPALTRRTWMAAAAALAIAASLFIAFTLYPRARPLGPEGLMEIARQFPERQLQSATDPAWMKSYPPSTLVQGQTVSWAVVKNFAGRSGVVYNLQGRGGATAMLFVLDGRSGPGGARFVQLPVAPAAMPVTTGGSATAVWTSGDRVFVLVVPGGEREYRTFIRRGGLA